MNSKPSTIKSRGPRAEPALLHRAASSQTALKTKTRNTSSVTNTHLRFLQPWNYPLMHATLQLALNTRFPLCTGRGVLLAFYGFTKSKVRFPAHTTATPVPPHAPHNAALCFLKLTGLRPHDCHELRSVLPWPSMFTCERPGLLLVLRWVLPEELCQVGLHRLVEVWVCKQAAHRENDRPEI